MNLVKKVLENAGMDEGEWYLRLPHRIRKKGNERFKAIRQDHNGKVRGVRIRCKPAGNDTSFEYTLVPPSDVDTDTLFSLLSRVHPKNLDIYDTLAMKAAIQYPEIRELAGTKPIFPLRRHNRSTEEASAEISQRPDTKKDTELEVGTTEKQTLKAICSEFATPVERLKAWKERSESEDEFCPETGTVCDGTVIGADADGVYVALPGGAGGIIPTPNVDKIKNSDSNIEKISSLALTEPILLSDQEAMDRALIAIAFVSQNGYAKRTAASNSIIQNLEILNFIEKISKGGYVSVEGAMRALTMALRKNNYIERVHCSPKTDAVKGYKITHKGEKRILALKKFLSNEILHKINHDWVKFTDDNEESIELIENTIEDSKQENPIVENEIEHYEKLEALISALKDANNQIVEANGFIDNLNSEKTDLSVELFGIEKAIEEQIKCKEEIEKRISKLQGKKEEIKNKVGEKQKEIEDWRMYQGPYMTEKDKIKKQIETLAGSVGIGVS